MITSISSISYILSKVSLHEEKAVLFLKVYQRRKLPGRGAACFRAGGAEDGRPAMSCDVRSVVSAIP